MNILDRNRNPISAKIAKTPSKMQDLIFDTSQINAHSRGDTRHKNRDMRQKTVFSKSNHSIIENRKEKMD